MNEKQAKAHAAVGATALPAKSASPHIPTFQMAHAFSTEFCVFATESN
ncbi:MAG: hypothetical protein ACI4O8_03490 [Aristaeellaceae bacterium]